MKQNAYKESGVDIEAGAEAVDRIKPLASATKRPGVMGELGSFGAFFDLKETQFSDPILVASTDGVGTKLRVAIEMDMHDTVGIDLVAMCVNDIIVQGAEPLFFLDYFASSTLKPDHVEKILQGIAKGCQLAGCALIGGEMAEMPGMYAKGDYDLAGFCVGAVERSKVITGDNVQEGDSILAITSSGLHSNGFSLVRRIIETSQGYQLDSKSPFENEKTLGESILEPTRIYVRPLLQTINHAENQDNAPLVKAMANITGGGLQENIPRCIPKGLCAEIDVAAWDLPPIFHWLAEAGNRSGEDMLETFNCGIGMTVICAPEQEETLTSILQEQGENVFRIGQIISDSEPIIMKNTQGSQWFKN